MRGHEEGESSRGTVPSTEVLRNAPTIGLLAQAGSGNLGDEATLATVIEDLRRRIPDVRVRAYTINPRDTELRHGVEALPRERGVPPSGGRYIVGPEEKANGAESSAAIQEEKGGQLHRIWRALRPARAPARGAWKVLQELRFLPTAYRSLEGVDLLLVPGSGPLSEVFGGPWGKPFSLLRWTLLARLRRINVVVVSAGAERIERPVSRWLLRIALRLARRRSYRDGSSRALVESIGGPSGDPVVPDIVLGAAHSEKAGSEADGARELTTVGVNPLPYGNLGRFDGFDPEYRAYLERIAELVEFLANRERRVVLFPTQIRVDPRTIQDLLGLLDRRHGHRSERVSVAPVRNLDGLVETVASLDAVVATRYHGLIFPLTMRKPVLGIAYQRKSRDLLEMFGMGRFCADASAMTEGELPRRFEELEDTWKRGALRWAAFDEILAAQTRELDEIADLCQTPTKPARAPDLAACLVRRA